jgi:hypothetical protein
MYHSNPMIISILMFAFLEPGVPLCILGHPQGKFSYPQALVAVCFQSLAAWRVASSRFPKFAQNIPSISLVGVLHSTHFTFQVHQH